MSIEDNKALIRRYITEAWNTGNLALLDELLAPDFVSVSGRVPSEPMDREDAKQGLARLRTAFPDLTSTIETMLAEGDQVAYRWTMRGTHQGELWDIPPTGKSITLTGITINRIVDGKIVEDWFESGSPSIVEQLGIEPLPE